MLICFSSVFVFATAARPRYETFFFLKLKKWELGKNLELKLRFLLLTLRGGWARPLPLHISDERLAAHHQPRRWLEQRDQGAGLVIFKIWQPRTSQALKEPTTAPWSRRGGKRTKERNRRRKKVACFGGLVTAIQTSHMRGLCTAYLVAPDARFLLVPAILQALSLCHPGFSPCLSPY